MARAHRLSSYHGKRDFGRTPEPAGSPRPPRAASDAEGRGFVIQQHAARRMHYDFRLELDGVLVSWSVPRGPSLDPRDRRLAVRTEDHPIEYADFEGVIPPHQYGAGTVIVWDRGAWHPEGDPRDALARGKLTFTLEGEKLHGRWHLIRLRPQGKQETWLLFKGRDEAAREAGESEIVARERASVLTGKTIDEVAAAPERVWSSNRPADVAALVAQLPLGFPLTNLDKVLYPEEGLTKGQLIAYLAVAAEHMLPHVAGRPLTLVRCPDGSGRPCFYQKHVAAGTPSVVAPLAVPGDDLPYMVVHDLAGLIALAQLGSLEIHTWGCRGDDVERPDVIVFDLDPDPSVPWERVALGALEIRRRLGERGLDSFVKTTGGKGLHVVAPLEPAAAWPEVKAFTKAIADAMEHDHPTAYTASVAKARRRGRIFVDYLRNVRGATFVAPWSPRAAPHALVATPITWDELAAGVDPASFTIVSVPPRLASRGGEAWRAYDAVRQRLPPAARVKRAARPSGR